MKRALLILCVISTLVSCNNVSQQQTTGTNEITNTDMNVKDKSFPVTMPWGEGVSEALHEGTLDGLAEEDREAIQRAAGVAYKTLGSVMTSSFDTQTGDLKREGAKVRILEPGEVRQWETATRHKELQLAWVREQEEKGVKNVGATMAKVSAIMDDFIK